MTRLSLRTRRSPGRSSEGSSAKPGVAKCAGGAIHHQHAALAALRGRLLRDKLWRQVEIEIGDAQIGTGLLAGHRGAWPK